MDLYADWCTYCKVLHEKIYPDPEVEKALDSFIKVQINGEEFPNLMEAYGLNGFPSLIWIDSKGNLLQKVTGLASKQTIVQLTQKSLLQFQEELENQKKLAKNPNDITTLYRLGNYYYRGGDPLSAKEYFQRAIRSEDPDLLSIRMNAQYNLGLVFMDLEEQENAILVWKQYLDKFPESKDLAEVHYFLGSSYASLGKKQDAKSYYKKALQLNPSPNLKKKIDYDLAHLN